MARQLSLLHLPPHHRLQPPLHPQPTDPGRCRLCLRAPTLLVLPRRFLHLQLLLPMLRDKLVQ